MIISPAITNAPKVNSVAAEAWEVQSKNVTTGNVYKIARNAEGIITRSCTTAGKGGCPPGGAW